MSFKSYLRDLADPAKPLAVSEFVQLSNLGAEESPLFRSAWQDLEPARRGQLIQGLIGLAEDNVDVNFDATFFIALEDPEPAIRFSAIQGLWEYDGRDLIERLHRLLEDDSDAAVRAEAALALGRFILLAELGSLRSSDAKRTQEALRRVVEDPAEITEVRGRALESIGPHDEAWVRDLIAQSFESDERRMRLSAVHAMGRSCDAAWLPDLLPELEDDDAEMRFEAAGACGLIADQAAVPHLLPLLQDDDLEAQEAAIAALGEIGGQQAKDALEELQQDADDRVREAALSALAGVDFANDPLGLTVRE